MKSIMLKIFCLLFLFFLHGSGMWAQDVEMTVDSEMTVVPKDKPVKNMFESIWILDNQTVVVPIKGTIEFDLQHRFGVVENGYDDLWGLFAPANIRLGLAYVPAKNLMVGFGITKTNLTWDLNAKYAIIQQTRSGSTPISITYFVNAALDTRDKDYFTNPDELVATDRLSYFHQILLARKFSDKLSLQLAGSLSHFNTVDAYENPENEIVQKWNNDHFAVAVSGRYNVSSVMNLLVNLDFPLTSHESVDPQPNISFGIEIVTSAHQFQFFAGNYYNIVPQRNNVFNNNDPGDGEFLIGFNMTRLWN